MATCMERPPTGCIRIFELKSVVFACDPNQEIQFGAGMGCPKVGIAAFECSDDLLQSETLPRCAEFRMRLQVRQGAQLKQSMQNAAVANIDLGSLDLPFTDILEPGRKDSDHVGTGENIQIPASRVFGGAKRPGKLRCIPDLTMVMGDHGPETSQGFCGNGNTELRNIPFEKRSDEVIAPGNAGRIIVGQKGPRKPATQPAARTMLHPHFSEVEPGEIDKSDAAGEGFRYTFGQVWERQSQEEGTWQNCWACPPAP